jgi:hypothetical protein
MELNAKLAEYGVEQIFWRRLPTFQSSVLRTKVMNEPNSPAIKDR